MPRSAGDRAPAAYLVPGGPWPDGALVADAPVSVRVARAFAQRLRDALAAQGLSVAAAHRLSGVSRRSLDRALVGESMLDFGAVARLEATLGVDLWPGRVSDDPDRG